MTRTKRQTAQHSKRANHCIKGTIFSWIDEDPLAEGSVKITPAEITHRNPYYRLTAAKVLNDFGDWLTKKQSFRWQLTIEAHCFDGKDEYVKSVELEAICRFFDINEVAMESVELLFANLNLTHYQHFTFIAEVLGT